MVLNPNVPLGWNKDWREDEKAVSLSFPLADLEAMMLQCTRYADILSNCHLVHWDKTALNCTRSPVVKTHRCGVVLYIHILPVRGWKQGGTSVFFTQRLQKSCQNCILTDWEYIDPFDFRVKPYDASFSTISHIFISMKTSASWELTVANLYSWSPLSFFFFSVHQCTNICSHRLQKACVFQSGDGRTRLSLKRFGLTSGEEAEGKRHTGSCIWPMAVKR